MKLVATLGAAAVVLGIGITPAAAKLYKWVDEDGNVFYSDQIPPEQSTKRHQILDERGVVRESVRRAKTPEEIEEIRKPVLESYERELSAYYATSHLWDDGLIDPADTRNVLGISISS